MARTMNILMQNFRFVTMKKADRVEILAKRLYAIEMVMELES